MAVTTSYSHPTSDTMHRKMTSGVLRGLFLSADARRTVAEIACSLETRQQRTDDVPLRGFFVAQRDTTPLEPGLYCLRLENGREELVNVDQVTLLAASSRQLGSFEILHQ